ncbi:phosphate ABC transporter membrane protein 1, PhoT family [Haloarcula vallismortis]|uniref:Phosphate transport system permease protein n=2 Tax=Haloarcula vallismortis TaxID=28442 RepID=M0JUF3_HALVA|nr:phosphate ABC transporter permease subunit PstC [Haloarcula vallismortis]EMA11305.1 phosphate ABC transporter, inner membrane subunit PstC [Haloarcula vallismortis ATCC 29715]SDW37441.1 phosphate ABC transporter membrane protein 1, PhoT family [Haloarcula vallismortis]
MSNTIDLSGDRGSQDLREGIYGVVFFVCAAISVLTTIGIILALVLPTLTFLGEVPIREFLLGTQFSPAIQPTVFGVLPLVFGTLLITVGAAAVALPVGLLTATYLSEYASHRRRAVLKPLLEILAGVPTVVYGYFALVYVTPLLDAIPGLELGTFNALSASLVMGIMIIPMVSSISEDSMSAVPESIRNAAYGLGATKYRVSTSVVIPSAVSGIASSYILALSRAIGETMIVVVAAGQSARFPDSISGLLNSFFQSTQTMTSAIVQLGTSDLAGGTTAYRALFAIGLTLFVMTFVLNVVSDVITMRYQEDYE